MTLTIWTILHSLIPIGIAMGAMFILLLALSLTLAYRSRRPATDPYYYAETNSKVATLGYYSAVHQKRVHPPMMRKVEGR